MVDVDKLAPEACAASIRALVDAKVHAISNAFLFVPIPAMDASVKWACPYLSGNTQRTATEALRANRDKYKHIFQVDPSEVHYGYHFPLWLQAMQDQGEKERDQFDPEIDVDHHLFFVDAFEMPWWQYSLERGTFEKSAPINVHRMNHPTRLAGPLANQPSRAPQRIEHACIATDCRSFGVSSYGTSTLHRPPSSPGIASRR